MPWTKLKNIILAILAVTNLCLLALLAGQVIQGGQTRAQAIVDWRGADGPLLPPEGGMEGKGIGPGIYGEIEAYITVDITD